MSLISSASGAADYYTAQAKVEYYANEVVPSAWGGRGAELNGLSGAVQKEDLTRVLLGKVTELVNGEFEEKQLGRTVMSESGEKTLEHRAGWDLTFAPPKSVSVESEVFGAQGVRDAHKAAVSAAMQYLEENAAQARVSGRMVETGNLVYASFEHATSRAGDPQTHTHVLIANVTYINGKAYSLSNEQLMQQRTAADAVYKNELAAELTRQGYQLEHGERGSFEISGYSQRVLDGFSKRSEQIGALLDGRGVSKDDASYGARQVAALATRDDKGAEHSESAEAHRTRWQIEAAAAGVVPALKSEVASEARRPTARDIISSAAESLAEREQVFSKKDLVKEAMLQSGGRIHSGELLAEITTQAAAGDLVQRDPGRAGPRYTTEAAIKAEVWADKQIADGRGGHTNILTAPEFDQALASFESAKGMTLTSEQRFAARQILTGEDQFSAVQGSAGTGKTTMLELVREAAEAKGWTVQGISNGAVQASKLEADSGIKSTTTASFLARDKAEIATAGQSRILFVNDEASMSGQREFNGVIDRALSAGAKTVFVGDTAQHQSVAAGGAFERAQTRMTNSGMEVSYLTQISRQKTDQAKAPVQSIIAGNHSHAVALTAREFSPNHARVKGRWDEIAARQGHTLTKEQTRFKREELTAAAKADNKVVISEIAKDYVKLSSEKRARTAIVTGTNDDRRAINEAIRLERKAMGELANGALVETLRSKDMTKAQAEHASTYQAGDVLKQVSKGNKVDYLTVKSTNIANNKVTIVDAAGKITEMHASKAAKMMAYSPETRELAIGDKVSFFENDKTVGLKNGDTATVVQIERGVMTVSIDGKQKAINLSSYKQFDHGYVMTSFKSQGQTVDRTLVHHNTEAGMHGQREAYVNLTRARLVTTTYTQDRDRAGQQAAKAVHKTHALRSQVKPTLNAGTKAGHEGHRSTPTSNRQSDSLDLSFKPATYADSRADRNTSANRSRDQSADIGL